MTNIKKIKSVDVGIITYKRPELLRNCLESIIVQTVTNSLELSIIVVDNDIDRTADIIVKEFESTNNVKIKYYNEPEKNISIARNRCLDESQSDIIVFIDDDEHASPGWLERHVYVLEHKVCSAVLGPVVPLYPDITPSWLIESGVYERKKNKINSTLKLANTGNVSLCNRDITRLRFNKKYGLSGGGDTEFFKRFTGLDKIICWDDEAIVYEEVSLERLKLSWVMKRGFRLGQTHSKVNIRSANSRKKIIYASHQTILIFISIIRVVGACLIGRAEVVKYTRELTVRIGRLTGLFGDLYFEYKSK